MWRWRPESTLIVRGRCRASLGERPEVNAGNKRFGGLVRIAFLFFRAE